MDGDDDFNSDDNSSGGEDDLGELTAIKRHKKQKEVVFYLVAALNARGEPTSHWLVLNSPPVKLSYI